MNHNFDVIIVGGGAAGLYGAIQLPSYCKVLLICKQEMTLCNSSLAQGGIAGVYKSPEDDTPELHKQDTMIAGGFKNNPESVQILVEDAAMAIDSLLKLGADFDRKPTALCIVRWKAATAVTGFSTTRTPQEKKSFGH